jgi:hypothetical protein
VHLLLFFDRAPVLDCRCTGSRVAGAADWLRPLSFCAVIMSQAPALPAPQGAALPPALPSFVQHQLQMPPSIDVDDAAFREAEGLLRIQVEFGTGAVAPALAERGADEAVLRAIAAVFAHGGQRGIDVPVRDAAGQHLIDSAAVLPADLLAILRPRLLWLLADQAIGDVAVTIVWQIVVAADPPGQPASTLGFEQWPGLAKGILDQMGRCMAAGLEAEKRVLQLLRSLFDLSDGACARAMLTAAQGTEDDEAAAAGGMRVADRLVRMLAHYLGHPAELVRLLALRVVMLMVEQCADVLDPHTDTLSAALSDMLSTAIVRPMLVDGVRAALNE